MNATNPAEFRVHRGEPTPVWFRTQKRARCFLHPPGASRIDSIPYIEADDDGVMRVELTIDGEGEGVELILECDTPDGWIEQQVRLRFVEGDLQNPSPPARRRGGSFRPGLSESDRSELSDDELLDGGYPRRPDPEASDQAREAWHRAVGADLEIVELTDATRPHRHLGNVTIDDLSPNWSGLALGLDGNSYKFDTVAGFFEIPSPNAAPPYLKSHPTHQNFVSITEAVSIWVGFDGNVVNPNLWQVGVEVNRVTYQWDVFGQPTVTSYPVYSWFYEFLNDPSGSHYPGGLNLNSGDAIFLQLGLYRTPAGSSTIDTGYYLVDNYSAGTTTALQTFSFVANGGNPPGGQTVEWIVERPEPSAGVDPGFTYAPLAAFTDFSFEIANAVEWPKKDLPCQGTAQAASCQYIMRSDGTIHTPALMTATPDATLVNKVDFHWVSYT
jgi:Peptidase A4 family